MSSNHRTLPPPAAAHKTDNDTYGGSFTDCIDKIARHVLGGLDGPGINILLGPVMWEPHPKVAGQRGWYFIAISGKSDDDDCRIDKLASGDTDGGEGATRMRLALWARLISGRPIVIHDFDDELEMAKWAAGIWPTARLCRIRDEIEAERGAAVSAE